ncbi:MAG: D-alanyl-D-alanine carboxypeptidase family protein [Bariatricus sp.]
MTEYEKAHYNADLYKSTLYAEELCVAEENVALEGYEGDTGLHASALFDLGDKSLIYSWQSHDRLYPASTTKIMTALLALEKGDPEDLVTISRTAAAASFPSDAQVCGLREGDVWSLKALLNALLLHSGNDAASAIAEYIAGSEESFVNMMNDRAGELMANNTHFTNPHGLHDDNHYTTAYDLYLIFNECIKNEHFVEIISSDSYRAVYTAADGSTQEMTFVPTNLYAKGLAEEPENVTIIGGKTGTTDEAGCCLILLVNDMQDRPYISIVMGAPDKSTLYEDMTSLIEKIA